MKPKRVVTSKPPSASQRKFCGPGRPKKPGRFLGGVGGEMALDVGLLLTYQKKVRLKIKDFKKDLILFFVQRWQIFAEITRMWLNIA